MSTIQVAMIKLAAAVLAQPPQEDLEAVIKSSAIAASLTQSGAPSPRRPHAKPSAERLPSSRGGALWLKPVISQAIREAALAASSRID